LENSGRVYSEGECIVKLACSVVKLFTVRKVDIY
jgi:hypothetical protein